MTKSIDLASRSLSELRAQLLDRCGTATAGAIEALAHDSRMGARRLARQIQKRQIEDRLEQQRLCHLLQYEMDLWDRGLARVAGVDEAGMGPLAGPVIAAAVILKQGYMLPGLNDSKKVSTETARLELAGRIKTDSICWAVGRAEVEEIDRINIYHAGLLAMQRAVQGLTVHPDYLLVDARTVPQCAIPQRGIVHGDALSASIAAASIIAKTTRDALMAEFDALYPGYNFASHKGYPTPEHCRLLKLLGALPIHRRSFGRVRDVLGTEAKSAPGDYFTNLYE